MTGILQEINSQDTSRETTSSGIPRTQPGTQCHRDRGLRYGTTLENPGQLVPCKHDHASRAEQEGGCSPMTEISKENESQDIAWDITSLGKRNEMFTNSKMTWKSRPGIMGNEPTKPFPLPRTLGNHSGQQNFLLFFQSVGVLMCIFRLETNRDNWI